MCTWMITRSIFNNRTTINLKKTSWTILEYQQSQKKYILPYMWPFNRYSVVLSRKINICFNNCISRRKLLFNGKLCNFFFTIINIYRFNLHCWVTVSYYPHLRLRFVTSYWCGSRHRCHLFGIATHPRLRNSIIYLTGYKIPNWVPAAVVKQSSPKKHNRVRFRTRRTASSSRHRKRIIIIVADLCSRQRRERVDVFLRRVFTTFDIESLAFVVVVGGGGFFCSPLIDTGADRVFLFPIQDWEIDRWGLMLRVWSFRDLSAVSKKLEVLSVFWLKNYHVLRRSS